MKIKILLPLFCSAICWQLSFSQDTVKLYYPSGKLKTVHIKIDSVIYEKMFCEDGKLMTDGYVKFMDGKFRPQNLKIYYNNGIPRAIFCDTSGTLYDPNGDMNTHFQSINGIKNGNSFLYFEGALHIAGHYKNDKKDGKQTYYNFDSGMITGEEYFINGKLDGLSTEYDSLGKISQTTLYKAGTAVRSTYYDGHGKIVKTKNGKEEDNNRMNREQFIKDAVHHKD